MGSWFGHVGPGIFFMALSTWWMISVSYRYIKSKKLGRNGNQKTCGYHGSTTMPCLCCPCKKARNFFKLTILVAHVTVEISTGTKYLEIETHHAHSGIHQDASLSVPIQRSSEEKMVEKRFGIHEESLQHIIMLFGFLIASFVEVLIYFGISFPKKTDYIFNLIGGFIMTSTILLHLDGRDMIDRHLHFLFGIATIVLVIFYAFETYNPNNYWATFGRAYSLFVIGTWLIEIAFIVWPMTSNKMFLFDPMSMRDMSIITFTFGAHICMASIYFIILYQFVNKYFLSLHRCMNGRPWTSTFVHFCPFLSKDVYRRPQTSLDVHRRP